MNFNSEVKFDASSACLDFSRFQSIYMIRETIDMRKGIDGYASILTSLYGLDPFDQSLYIFSNKRHDKMKAVYYCGTGFWLLYLRLSRGRFKWEISGMEGFEKITTDQFNRLLEGKSLMPESGFSMLRPRLI